MKSLMNFIGIVLILVGIFTLSYQGFTYTKHEQVAKIGDVQITADTQKTVYFPPIMGGASLIAGIVLIVITRLKIKS